MFNKLQAIINNPLEYFFRDMYLVYRLIHAHIYKMLLQKFGLDAVRIGSGAVIEGGKCCH